MKVDVAIRVEEGWFDIRATIRVESGSVVTTCDEQFTGFYETKVGETLALCQGLRFAKVNRFWVGIVECDAQRVVHNIESSSIWSPSPSTLILSNVIALMKEASVDT